MKTEILIIGAGAAGLMAARELAKAGKKVVILEARDRIGGRIMPLSESEFGYPAQGGAEFVHGEAPVTKALLKEAGLTFVPEEDGEIWSARGSEFSLYESFFLNDESLKAKLNDLKEDVPIADFLEQYFGDEKYTEFRNSIIKNVEGYDAADPKLVSTFQLRDEWLSEKEWHDGKIKEGYGALLDFLQNECKKYGIEIYLNACVKSVSIESARDSEIGRVLVTIENAETWEAQKVVVTVPLPVLKDIEFNPDIKEKLVVASRIGFGNAIKLVIKFKTRWWIKALEKDLSKMFFMICNEKFMTWWTQYPEINPVLVGWMAGPETEKYKNSTSEELLDIALTSLSNVFKIDKDILMKEIVISEVVNWSADSFSKGAYSFTTIYTKDSYRELAEPIGDKIFFAGEATYWKDPTATAMVEGALGSGLEVAKEILL